MVLEYNFSDNLDKKIELLQRSEGYSFDLEHVPSDVRQWESFWWGEIFSRPFLAKTRQTLLDLSPAKHSDNFIFNTVQYLLFGNAVNGNYATVYPLLQNTIEKNDLNFSVNFYQDILHICARNGGNILTFKDLFDKYNRQQDLLRVALKAQDRQALLQLLKVLDLKTQQKNIVLHILQDWSWEQKDTSFTVELFTLLVNKQFFNTDNVESFLASPLSEIVFQNADLLSLFTKDYIKQDPNIGLKHIKSLFDGALLQVSSFNYDTIKSPLLLNDLIKYGPPDSGYVISLISYNMEMVNDDNYLFILNENRKNNARLSALLRPLINAKMSVKTFQAVIDIVKNNDMALTLLFGHELFSEEQKWRVVQERPDFFKSSEFNSLFTTTRWPKKEPVFTGQESLLSNELLNVWAAQSPSVRAGLSGH